MTALVRASARSPLLVVLFAVLVAALGGWAAWQLPIDAVPDVTNVQVAVVTRASGLSAAEVEAQVTQPIERAMAGIPGLVNVRSVTKFGISIVTLVFADDTDLYFARAQVAERLANVRDQIPEEIAQPAMGPVATGLGEIFLFEVRGAPGTTWAKEDLRTIVEWQIAPRLRQVRGVVELVGWGGALKQYRVTIDPARLAAHGISLAEVRRALDRDNAVSGGGYVERHGEQVVLRADARFLGVEDIAQTVVRTDERGVPIRVGQLGEVDTGPAIRQGAATRDGRGEIVGATVYMLKGENSRQVVARVKHALDDLRPHLPAGVVIEPFYDRADFIGSVLTTVAKNLGEGALLVVLCLLLTLGTLRAGLLVAGAIPFAMLVGMTGLWAIGYSGNVMSLGAIDFGIVVEGTVVVVENALTRLGAAGDRDARRRRVVEAMAEVAAPVAFAVVIVLLVFLPLATLEDIEGRMFRPVVYSLCFMLFGALAYALVVVPAVVPLLMDRTVAAGPPRFARWIGAAYEPVLRLAIARPGGTMAICFAAAAALIATGARMGAEFLPRMFEGAFTIDALRPPSCSLRQAMQLTTEAERAALSVPEATTAISLIGRPEGSIDPFGPESSDTYVLLRPRDAWRPGVTPESLAEEVGRLVDAAVPATVNAVSQPIEERVNELVAGVRADLAVKIFGDELDTMADAAEKVRRAVLTVPGAHDVKMERATGMPAITVRVDRLRAARLGVPAADALDALAATRAGLPVGVVREGERVFDLLLRLGGHEVRSERDVERLPIATAHGAIVPLTMVADVDSARTIVQIGREKMRRRLIVQSNVRGRDLVGFAQDVQARVATLGLPRSLEVKWGGQFANYERARDRLLLLVPVALAVIAVLLVMTLGRVRHALITMMNLPFALAGGVAALTLRGLPFSIPAGVGFIALSGVSVMNGVVMASRLARQPPGAPGLTPVAARVAEAARSSLRAIASTALVAAVGFVPAAIATGAGAEVQRPLATVVIGGLLGAMALALPALPAMLLLSERIETGAKPQP